MRAGLFRGLGVLQTFIGIGAVEGDATATILTSNLLEPGELHATPEQAE